MTPESLPAWLDIAIAEEARGVAEQGTPPNSRILEYVATCADLTPEELADDATPWCAAFMNWCFRQAGMAGTDSSWARDWAAWGVEDDTPGPGTVVVWRRIVGGDLDGPYGHCAFLIEDRGDELLVLGGNQDDAVCCRLYPREGRRGDEIYTGIVFRKLKAGASNDAPALPAQSLSSSLRRRS